MLVGTLDEIDVFPRIVQWTIPDFFELPNQIGYMVHSPYFRLWSWRCRFAAQPNGTESLPGNVVILLHGIDKVGRMQWELEVRRATDEKILRKCIGWKEDGDKVEMKMFIPYTEVEKRCYTSGGLKVRCILYCEETFDYLEKEKVKHTGSQTEEISRTDKLSQDLEELFHTKDDSDVTFRVEGKEFKLHKNILRTRTPVFKSMFRHQMSESITGVVDIDDCDAVTFEEFLHYLYTGRINNFSQNVIFNLHKVADKYQVNELKEYCLEYIKNNLSVESFFDAVILSFQLDEEELKDMSIKFLKENIAQIPLKDWEKFVSDNPLVACTVLSKAFNTKKPKKVFDINSLLIKKEWCSGNPSLYAEIMRRVYSILIPISKT